jgi:hypothetical protein
MEYLGHPDRYDPSRGVTLESFINLAAARNVINTIQANRRRQVREGKYASSLARQRVIAPVSHARTQLADYVFATITSASERRFLVAWLKNMEPPADTVRALGLTDDLTERQRRAALKRIRERILKRASRRIHAARVSPQHSQK